MKTRSISCGLLELVLFMIALLACQRVPATADEVKAVPVYRFYFTPWQTHLYSTNQIPPGEGWNYECIAFYVSPVSLPYTIPLYSVYNADLYDHFYTVSAEGRDYCVKDHNYADQGVLGYVVPKENELYKTSPLYRWVWAHKFSDFNKQIQDHFYQTYDAKSSKDYKYETVECRVWTEPVSLPPETYFNLTDPFPGVILQVNENVAIRWNVWSNEGYVRLSYTKDNGSSWFLIDYAIPSIETDMEGMMPGTYQWKVPFDALSKKIMIKAEWKKDKSDSTVPWAKAVTGPMTVLSASSPPPAALTLTAVLKESKQAELSWTHISPGVTGFSVERKTQGGQYGILTTLGKSTTTYTDASLTPGVTYVYRVRAWIGGKPSSPSNEVSLSLPQAKASQKPIEKFIQKPLKPWRAQ